MSDDKKVEVFLKDLKSKIEAHNKFKEEYNKQLAFDFNFHNFFKIGENKVSEILAYFLNDKQSHGQGDAFLRVFVNQFYKKHLEDFTLLEIKCEKVITNKRRIDIYLKLNDFVIAIENKLGAEDQKNQLSDYAKHLKNENDTNYLLLYLTPYGEEPTEGSIKTKIKEKLIDSGNLKIISYKNDIIPLLNKWIGICEADNVSYFIKEFKKHLETKYLGKNTLNMSNELSKIILNNKIEVQNIVDEYNNMKSGLVSKINKLAEEIIKKELKVDDTFVIEKGGAHSDNKRRVYAYTIGIGNDKIAIECVAQNINLRVNYYSYSKPPKSEFEIFVENYLKNNGKKLEKNRELPFNTKVSELVSIFQSNIGFAKKILKDYKSNENSSIITNSK